MGNNTSMVLDNIVQGTNCEYKSCGPVSPSMLIGRFAVDREEVERLKKRFMKLDKVRYEPRCARCHYPTPPVP